MSFVQLRLALWILLAIGVGVLAAWGVGKVRDHARAPLLERIRAMEVQMATADELARARLQVAQEIAEVRERENAKANAAELARLADVAAARDRDHDALVGRMRAALAARARRLPDCRGAMPEAGRDPGAGAAEAVRAGGDRARADPDPAERSAAFIERTEAVNELYQSLVAAAKAGRCIVIKE